MPGPSVVVLQFRFPGVPTGIAVPSARKPPLTQLVVSKKLGSTDLDESMLSITRTRGVPSLTLISKPANASILIKRTSRETVEPAGTVGGVGGVVNATSLGVDTNTYPLGL